MEKETGIELSFILRIKKQRSTLVKKPTYDQFRRLQETRSRSRLGSFKKLNVMGSRRSSFKSIASRSRKEKKIPTISNFCRTQRDTRNPKTMMSLGSIKKPNTIVFDDKKNRADKTES